MNKERKISVTLDNKGKGLFATLRQTITQSFQIGGQTDSTTNSRGLNLGSREYSHTRVFNVFINQDPNMSPTSKEAKQYQDMIEKQIKENPKARLKTTIAYNIEDILSDSDKKALEKGKITMDQLEERYIAKRYINDSKEVEVAVDQQLREYYSKTDLDLDGGPDNDFRS